MFRKHVAIYIYILAFMCSGKKFFHKGTVEKIEKIYTFSLFFDIKLINNNKQQCVLKSVVMPTCTVFVYYSYYLPIVI